ncbi:MAG: HIT family protein [Candidatus Diapherotrites archaeon]|nr:HIT family protein [Candidatus Diapherotrites archaeon]
MDCVFCKIVKGEIPCSKLYEDDLVMSFLDIMPASKGHSLVITKKHHETLLELSQEELETILKTTQKVAFAIMKATKADGFNIIQSNGKAAGQVINHIHFHIIPRKQGDGLNFSWKQNKEDLQNLEELKKMIIKHL